MSDTDPVSVTPLEGKTSIEGQMLFEPTRLGYESANRLADRIAEQVQKAVQGREVVVAGSDLLSDLANLNAVIVVLEGLERDYERLAMIAQGFAAGRASNLASRSGKVGSRTAAREDDDEEEIRPQGVVATVVAGVQAALGLVSLFREDVEFHGTETTLDSQAFDLALAARLQEKGAQKVLIPDFAVFSPVQGERGSLLATLESVQEAKKETWKVLGPVISELVRFEAELDRAVAEKNQALVDKLSSELSVLRRSVDPLTEPLSRLDQQLNDLQVRWNQPEGSTGLTLLARLLRAEAIRNLGPLFLHAKVVFSGGHLRTSRSLLRMLFTGDGLTAMGGAIARWALLGENGAVVLGGIVSERQSTRFPRPPL